MTFVVIGALRLKTSVLQKKLKHSSILFGEHKENNGLNLYPDIFYLQSSSVDMTWHVDSHGIFLHSLPPH